MFTTTLSGNTPLQRLIAGWLAALQIVAPMLYARSVHAQAAPTAITPDRGVQGQRPVVNVAANGIPVVQIAPPSAAGVSNNRFVDYNVGERGLVLNNSGANNRSQLAGWIAGNPMLGNASARTILNQVTGSAPTSLAGHTEVAGNPANVIVANPNGITCAGCGFINAPRVTLSTGGPELDADGAVRGFLVQQGRIAIEGSGFAARNVHQVDLIARSLRVNAEIWANKLEAATGTGRVDYDTGAITAHTAGSDAPAVSIDVSHLGGMYADSIRLVGSENGVGVNSAGNIAALAGSLDITQTGDVRIVAGSVRSAEGLSIRSAAGITNAGAVLAEGTATLHADGPLANTGVVIAGRTLRAEAGSLDNTGSLAAGAGADGRIKAAHDLVLLSEGDVRSGGQLLAGKDLALSARNAVLEHATLTAVGKATLNATGNLEHRNGVLLADDIALAAGGAFINAVGTVEAKERLSIVAPRIDNTRGTLRQTAEPAAGGASRGIQIHGRQGGSEIDGLTEKAAGVLINDDGVIAANAATDIKVQSLRNTDGVIQSAGELTIRTEQGLDNGKGRLLAGDALRLTTGGSLDNTGGQALAERSVSIAASRSLINRDEGRIQGNAVHLDAFGIDNAGGRIVQTGEERQTITASDGFRNAGGILQSNAVDLTLNARSIDNARGSIQHGGTGTLSLTAIGDLDNAGGAMASNGDVVAAAGERMTNTQGMLSAKRDIALDIGMLDNDAGTVSAEGRLDVQASGALRNLGGLLQANGGLTLRADTFGNGARDGHAAGNVVAAGAEALTIALTGTLDNAGGRIAANGDVALAAGSIDNAGGIVSAKGSIQGAIAAGIDNRGGTLVSERAMTLAAAGAVINGKGIVQGGSLDLHAGSIDNAAGTIQQVGAGEATIRLLGDLGNAQGNILADRLAVVADGIDNREGAIAAAGRLDIAAAGAMENGGGKLVAAGPLDLQAGRVDNTRGGRIQSGGSANFNITYDLLNASGTIVSGGRLDLAVGGDVTNQAGIIEAATGMTLAATNIHNNAGRILLPGDAPLKIDAGKVLDNAGGTIASNGSVTVTAKESIDNTRGTMTAGRDLKIDTDKFLNRGGTIDANGTLMLTMKDVFDNRGGKLGVQGGLVIHAGGIDNSVDNFGVRGELAVHGDGLLELRAQHGIDNAGGFIGSRGDVVLSAHAIDNSGGIVVADRSVSLTGAGEIRNVSGTVQAGTLLDVAIAGSLDNRQGTLQASTMHLKAGDMDNRNGDVLQLGAGANLLELAGELDNTGGRIAGNGDSLRIAADGITNNEGVISHKGTGVLAITGRGTVANGAGSILAAGNLEINAGTLINAGTGGQRSLIQSGGDAAITVGGDWNNASGNVISAGALRIAVGGNADNRAGLLQAGTILDGRIGGALDNRGGRVVADGMDLQAGTLDNRAGGMLQIGSSGGRIGADGVLSNSGGTIRGAGDVLRVAAGTLDNSEGYIVHEGPEAFVMAAGSLDNNDGRIQTAGALSIEAGAMSNDRGIGAGGIVHAGGDATILVAGGFTSMQGRVSSAGALTIRAQGDLNNADGLLEASQGLVLHGDRIDNTRGRASVLDGSMAIHAISGLNNTEGFIGGNGGIAINVRDGGIDNRAGEIRAAKDLTLTAAGSVDNRQGKLRTVEAFAGTVGAALDNRAGLIQAGRMDLTAAELDNRTGRILQTDTSNRAASALMVTGMLRNGENGLVGSNGTLRLDAGSLDNAGGELRAKSSLTVRARSGIDNRGGLVQADSLQVQASGLLNGAGTIMQSGTADASLAVTGTVDNAKGIIAANGDHLRLSAGVIDNSGGDMRHTGSGAFDIRAGYLGNAGGRLRTVNDLIINAGQVVNTDLNGQGGLIQGGETVNIAAAGKLVNSGGSIEAEQTLAVQAGTFDNARGLAYSKSDLIVTAGALDNTEGRLQADGVLTATATQEFVNRRGLLQAQELTLQASGLDNSDGRILQTGTGGAVLAFTGAIKNAAGTIATNATDLTLEAAVIDNSQGELTHAGGGRFAIAAASLLNNGGKLRSAGELAIDAESVANQAGAIESRWDMALDSAAGIDNSGGNVISAGKLDIRAQGQLANAAGRLESAGALALQAAGIDNTTGRIVALGSGEVSVETAGTLVNRNGTIGGNGAVALAAASLDNTAGQITGFDSVAIEGHAVLNAAGKIISQRQLTIDLGASGVLTNTGLGLLQGEAVSLSGHDFNNTGGNILQLGSGDMSLLAGGEIDNTGGSIATNGNLTLGAPSIKNQRGTVRAADTGSLGIDTTGIIDNAGGVLAAGGRLSASASGMNNRDGKATAAGELLLTVSGDVDNTQGTLASQGDNRLEAAGLVNHGGSIASTAGALALTVAGQLDNAGGRVTAHAALDIRSGRLDNQAGLLEAGDALTIDTHGQTLLNTQSSAGKGIVGQKAVTLVTGTLDNRGGYIGAKDALAVTATDVDNSDGAITGEAGIDITATGLVNAAGLINAKGDVNLALGTGKLDNDNGLVLAAGTLTVRAGVIDNGNTKAEDGSKGLQGNDVSLDAGMIDNAGGTIRANHLLTLSGGSLDNDNGTISSAGTVINNVAATTNAQGMLIAATRLALNSKTADGAGQYLSLGELEFNYDGSYTNTGQLAAAGNMTIRSGGSIVNSGRIEAENVLHLSATDISNLPSGEIQAGTLNLKAAHSLNNNGLIDGGTVNIEAGGAVFNTGRIYGNTLGVTAGIIDNADHAVIAARGSLKFSGGGITNRTDALILSIGDMTINSSGMVYNRSGAIETFGNMTIGAAGVENRNDFFTMATRVVGSERFTGHVLPGGTTPLAAGSYALIGYDHGRLITDSKQYPIALFGAELYPPALNRPIGLDDGSPPTPNYGADSRVWILFGVAPPEPEPLQPYAGQYESCYGEHPGDGCFAYYDLRAAWQAQTAETYAQLDAKIAAFNNDLYSRMVEDWYIVDAIRTTTETRSIGESKPGRISAGGNLTLNGPAGSVLNDKSQIVVGGTIDGSASTVVQIQDKNELQHTDAGTWQLTELVSSRLGDHKRIWHGPGPYEAVHAPVSMGYEPVWKFDKGTAPQLEGDIDPRQAIRIDHGANGATIADIHVSLATQTGGVQADSQTGALTGHGIARFDGVASGAIGSIDSAAGVSGAAAVPGATAGVMPLIDGLAVEDVAATATPPSAGGATGAPASAVTIYGAGGKTSYGVVGTVSGPSRIDSAAVRTTVAGAQSVSTVDGNAVYHAMIDIKAGGNGDLRIRSIAPNLSIPRNALFAVRSEPGVRYLVETDPRFADFSAWINSDFMLRQLGQDPAKVLKRLGDSFYEQRLVTEQIVYATGYPFVGDYRDNEEQYQALMQNGVEFGKAFKLTIGVALSEEQMRQLTNDIVWLVERDVTLADGSVQRVLTPQVYVRVKEGAIRGDGTLIAADNIDLKLTGDLRNGGLIATRDLMKISGENIDNLSGGRLRGGRVDLKARNDINNLSGEIAGNKVRLEAGRDVNVRTQAIETKGLNSTTTELDEIASVKGDKLAIIAGRDLNLLGAEIEAGEDALLKADRHLTVGTVQTGGTMDIGASGHIRATEVRNVGSLIKTGG
ncbi:MAG TPA: filamentous hemagglutinin N-terminal domain-containing protein [Paucimonas sp.]|nr:filamentous hemagglutinin N-terminal domain-containing protein [Paucimonas sp.]